MCPSDGGPQLSDVSSCPRVDLWRQGRNTEWALDEVGGRDAGTSCVGAVPLRLVQMMGQKQKLTPFFNLDHR